MKAEMHWPCLLWCHKVCSYSNPSDGPSHGRVKETCIDLGLNEYPGGKHLSNLHYARWSLDTHICKDDMTYPEHNT